MADYTINGITYDDSAPHSRIEKQLIDILSKMKDSNSSDDNNTNNDPNNQNGGD